MTESVLLPYQQRWVADKSQVKICEKSRRVGLSWGEASNSVLEAAVQSGQDTWYLGYSQDMAQEFIRDCAWWSGHFQIAAEAAEEVMINDEDNDILSYRINFASGKRITALSSSPRNLRGKQGRVVIDEAAFHPDLKELLKAAFALLIWGGSVSVISTHFGVDNPFNELINDVREGKKPYSLHRITFDDAIEQGLCKRVFASSKRVWSAQAELDWAEGIRTIYRPNDAEELDCVPSKSSGAYLSRALIESCMSKDSPVIKFECKDGFEQRPDQERESHTQDWLDEHVLPIIKELPPTARSSFGFDFGRSGDLSVLVPLLELQALERTCPFIVEMRNVPFKQQEQIVFWLADRLPRFNHGAFDARGNGQYLAEVAMQRYGSSSITQVMLAQGWYLEHMPKLKAALEDKSITDIPQDRDTLDDLRAITVIKGIPRIPETKTKKGVGQQRHGDTAVALCLAWYATNQGGGLIEYIEVAKRPSADRQNASAGFMRPRADLDVVQEHHSRYWD